MNLIGIWLKMMDPTKLVKRCLNLRILIFQIKFKQLKLKEELKVIKIIKLSIYYNPKEVKLQCCIQVKSKKMSSRNKRTNL